MSFAISERLGASSSSTSSNSSGSWLESVVVGEINDRLEVRSLEPGREIVDLESVRARLDGREVGKGLENRRSVVEEVGGVLLESRVEDDDGVVDDGEERFLSVKLGPLGVVSGLFGGIVDFVAEFFGSARRDRSGVDLSAEDLSLDVVDVRDTGFSIGGMTEFAQPCRSPV